MREIAMAARAMTMATKRAIERKRVLVSKEDNKMTATETMTMTTITMARNTTRMVTKLTMTTKKTTKKITMMTWWRGLVVAGGSRVEL
jgi:hypothetical protein